MMLIMPMMKTMMKMPTMPICHNHFSYFASSDGSPSCLVI
jgi:hypothetical protein